MKTENVKQGGAKPKGMAIAKARAAEAAEKGLGPESCPYKSRGWASAFLSELERMKQMELPV